MILALENANIANLTLMNFFRKRKKNSEAISKVSPLYEYWKSPQKEMNEIIRLKKASKKDSLAALYKNEPYKWENLFQSIIREIQSGDNDSIKGLKILIMMLSEEEQTIVFKGFDQKEVFSKEIIEKIQKCETSKSTTKKNLFRFIRILFSIFFNPYSIEIKGSKKHIYEKTGSALNNFRNLFL